MKHYEKLEILGKAFSEGEIAPLAKILSDDCRYNSDYAHKRMTSAAEIVERMHNVYDAVQEQSQNGENRTYSYEIIQLDSVFQAGVKMNELGDQSFFEVCEKGLLLYRNGEALPVAVVYILTNPVGMITEINLSRNRKWFNLCFCGEDELKDSEKDIPYTVKPMTSRDRQVQELRTLWTHQGDDYVNLNDNEVYVWRKADEFIKQWLKNKGYYVIASQIYDDCIGYRCGRKNDAYTVYMYAYGQKRTTQLDGEYCAKLLADPLSRNSIVLVVYLNVKRSKVGDAVQFSVCNYCGDEAHSIELWRVNEVNGRKILEFYPRKEIMVAEDRFMYAFNREDQDVYDSIFCDQFPKFNGLNDPGIIIGSIHKSLFRLHEKYGDMKIGYVRFNDVIYNRVPYIDGYGFFGFQVDNSTEKILEVTAFPFDGGKRKVAEFIKTDQKEDASLYANIPGAMDVQPLASVFTERFALKLTFDNGECRKYVLPIDSEYEKDEAVSYDNHVFTDKIWSTAKIQKSEESHRGTMIRFVNGYAISVLKCYEDGTVYAEPKTCGDTVFEDDELAIERCWKWNANSIWEDDETGLLKVLISGAAFNQHGISTFATKEGKRLCSVDFDVIDNFHEGLARIGKIGQGYGYIDKEMNLVIPMIYDNAYEFKDGKARVRRNGKWIYLDRNGEEIDIKPASSDAEYQDIGEFNEGMCKVSTLKLGRLDLAYHSDYAEIAGTWGFINEIGEEVIAPQYIYAEDFCGGVAVVCKGKWTIDKKWDNQYNTGRYWTEEELWGTIDKDGNEMIPFIFDEIKHFYDVDDVFMVHYGGWKNGCWGVINNRGKWLAEPVFKDIDYDYQDGLFAFYAEDRYNRDDVPMGIYDIKQKKVIFEPQFFDVSFRDDGWMKVEVFDESLGRRVEKLIDRNGNEKFHSVYTSIYTWKKPYEVMIRDENGDRHGLIDEDGTVILSCEYDVSWNGISYEQKLLVFRDGSKQGIKDFNGNVIVEPKYYEIHSIDRPLFTVRIGEKDNYTEGCITRTGKEVIPADYQMVRWLKDDYFVCCKDGLCEMFRLIRKR